MWQTLKQRPPALLVSILGHTVLLAALVYGIDSGTTRYGETGYNRIEPIKAYAVDKRLIDVRADKLEQARAERRQRERVAERAREQQKKIQAEQRARKVAAKKKTTEEKQRQKRARLAKIEAERQREEERVAALKAERQREEKRIAALEVERQREGERIAALEVERQREGERAAALEAEHQRRERRRLVGLLAEYEAAIGGKVARNWIKPENTHGSVECTVTALQIPSGEVIDVNVLSCSGGSDALARSVASAVLKASPLPLPKDSALFDRQLEFTFKPE